PVTCSCILLFVMPPPPPRSTLFPYTTLFRSGIVEGTREFFEVVHHAEPALRIGMLEGIRAGGYRRGDLRRGTSGQIQEGFRGLGDRKSTRLNSSHLVISYAAFCLKKKHTRTQ